MAETLDLTTNLKGRRVEIGPHSSDSRSRPTAADITEKQPPPVQSVKVEILRSSPSSVSNLESRISCLPIKLTHVRHAVEGDLGAGETGARAGVDADGHGVATEAGGEGVEDR